MEEFLRKLGIHDKPIPDTDGTFVIDLEDYDTYGRYYSRLDKSNEVDEDTSSSVMNEDDESIQFIGDDYIITLLANFKTDEYRLTIKEN